MNRAFKKSCFAAAWFVASETLIPSAWGSGLEGETSLEPAPTAVITTLKERRPLRRAKRFMSRALASAIRPLLLYPRHHLVMLLPSKRHLPAKLAVMNHNDFLPPFQWIPRGWTSFDWGRPALLAGNQKNFLDGAPKPIGERGSVQLSTYPELPVPLCWLPLYFAFTTPNGVHFRLGARWDDIDAYVVAPSIALKTDVD